MSIDETTRTDRAAPEVPATDLFVSIYRFFYSKVVGLGLILALALLATLGAVVMQAPPGLFADPVAREDFLAAARETYGGWTPLLDRLGLFHVFTSLPFYVIVAALALSIVACTTHRLPGLRARMQKPRVHVAATFFDKARFRAGFEVGAARNGDREASAATVTRVLRGAHFRVRRDPASDEVVLYADRNAWSGLGTVVAHLSFVTILAAFVVSSTWGIEEELAVPVGRPIEVGHGTGITLEATSFQDTYTEDGRPSDYVSHLVAREGESVVAEQDVRVNTPLRWGKFRYHQASFGTAADVVVSDASGQVVVEESVPLKWRSAGDTNALGKFWLPGAEAESIIAVAASGQSGSSLAPGTAHVILDDYGTEATLSQGTPAEIGDYTVTFERERQYTGIRMRHDPGAPLMWVGSALLVVGMCLTFLFPYRRLWISCEDTRVRLGTVGKTDTGLQSFVDSWAAQLEVELSKENSHGE